MSNILAWLISIAIFGWYWPGVVILDELLKVTTLSRRVSAVISLFWPLGLPFLALLAVINVRWLEEDK